MYTPDRSLDQPNDPNPEYFTYQIKVQNKFSEAQIKSLQEANISNATDRYRQQMLSRLGLENFSKSYSANTNFALETNSQEVMDAYNKMINPNK
jgi:hypothetical protein